MHGRKLVKGGARKEVRAKKVVHFKQPMLERSKSAISDSLETLQDKGAMGYVRPEDYGVKDPQHVMLDDQDSYRAAFHPPLPSDASYSSVYKQHHVQRIKELEQGEFIQVMSRKQAKESRRLGLDRRMENDIMDGRRGKTLSNDYKFFEYKRLQYAHQTKSASFLGSYCI